MSPDSEDIPILVIILAFFLAPLFVFLDLVERIINHLNSKNELR